jgi:hypothetical protein
MTDSRYELGKAIAEHVLGKLSCADLPNVAVQALELGYDGPAIRRLASLDKPSYFGVGNLFERVAVEIGVGRVSKKDASIYLSKRIAKEILSGTKEPLAGAYEIWLLSAASDHPDELLVFGGLDQDFNIPQTLDECKVLIALHTALDPVESFPSSC